MGSGFRGIGDSQEFVAGIPIFHLLEGQGAAVRIRSESRPIINRSATLALLASSGIISSALKRIGVRELEAQIHLITPPSLQVSKEPMDAPIDGEDFTCGSVEEVAEGVHLVAASDLPVVADC